MEKISVMGVNFDSVDLCQAKEICAKFLSDESGKTHIIHTPNSEIVQMCIEEPEKYELINSADLIIPDGSGVILASKILKKPLLKGKVAGVDLAKEMVGYCAQNDMGIFILGGKPFVAQTAAEKLCEEFPALRVCGTNDGYFKDEEEVISKINQSGAKFLLVCLGVPKQEMWLFENKHLLNAPLAGAFGGSVDVFAGNVRRAPALFIKLGLEWFYRLLCEPKRIGRMMKLPKFILTCVFSKSK